MFENSCARHKPVRIGLLGAAFDTSNMGVSALAESAIKCILHRWPNAEITLLDSGHVPGVFQLRVGDREVYVKKMPIRLCKNIFLRNHFIVLCLYALLFKVFRGKKFKGFCARRNAGLGSIIQMDMIVDITGGDSFSDIYGIRRFTIGFLRKWLVLFFNKDLMLLPQTYGPFKRRLARIMARYVLNRASQIYSRDQAGVDYVNNMLDDHNNGKVRFEPDVAFVLDARKPVHLNITPSADIRTGQSIVVGLNVSGLLFNGGYNRNNMFCLKNDYRDLINAVIVMLLKDERVSILLVPHVFSSEGTVECDPDACSAVYEYFKNTYKDRIFLTKGAYDQGEIKHIIGMCDFFMGSRMHACIAALSQGIPAVGIAYSGKFQGVFESIGLRDFVSDARTSTKDELLRKISLAFERRELIQRHLQNTIPSIQREVLDIFKGLEY